MNRIFRRRRAMRMLLIATGPAWLASAAPAEAQASSESEDANGNIIVTAQRREETVQASATAIAALSGKNLDERGINNVNDLQFAVPSVHSGSFGGATNISIRGVGASIGGVGVAVNIDGVYQTQGTTPDIAQTDLQRVEVLRGPQGTLYGRNATAGAVNFITRAPTGEFSASMLAGYAEYDEYHLQGVINAPLSDNVRLRIVMDYRDRKDGFIRNVAPDGQELDYGRTFSGRFRLAADITPDLDFDLSVTAMKNDGPTIYLTYYTPPEPIAFVLNPFLAGATIVTTPLRTNANDPSDRHRDYETISGAFTWRLPFGALKSITAFQRYQNNYIGDGDATNLSIAPYGGSLLDKTFTQEFDLSGKTGQLEWVTGLFYMRQRNVVTLSYSFPFGLTGLPPASYFDYLQPRYDTDAYAGFADATYHLTPSLKLIAGARYSEDHQKTRYGAQFGLLAGGSKIFLADICPLQTYQLDFASFTPRAGIQYDFDDKKNVYFTYSRGFKAGGANTFSCNDDFRPEKLTSYELGLKTKLFDDSLTLNAWGFYYDYTDFQVAQIVGLALDITNAGAARVKGVELEAAWAPDDHLSLNASFSWLDAAYTRFTNVDGLNAAAGVQDLRGNPLNNTPRTSGTLGVAWRSGPSSAGRFSARIDTSYRSRVYFREFNALADSQKPIVMVNLNLIWENADGKYSVRAYALNLGDEQYIQSLAASSSVGGRIVTWGSPRQIGGEFKVRF